MWATIKPDSPRAAEWLRVFESTTIPVLSPIPVRNLGPDGVAEFYHLDVAKLEPWQRLRLIAHIAAKFKLEPRQVQADIDDPDHGVPILATDVVVPIDLRLLV